MTADYCTYDTNFYAATQLSDLPPKLSRHVKKQYASVWLESDGWVLLQGETWLRRFESLDALERESGAAQ